MNIRFRILACLLSVLFASEQYGVHAQTKDYDAMLVDAVQKYNDGDFAQAASLLTKIKEAQPENDAACYYLGLCSIRLENYVKAEEELKKAVSLDSSNYWYSFFLARLYTATERADLAASIYTSLHKQYPKDREVLYELVNCYLSENRLDDALVTLEDIDALAGKSEQSMMMRFRILQFQNRQEESYKALEDYVQEYSSPLVLSMLGDWQMSMYNDSSAISYYDLALAIDRSYAPARIGKAEVFRLTRKFPEYFESARKIMADTEIDAAPKVSYLDMLNSQSDPRFVKAYGNDLDSLFYIAEACHPEDTAICRSLGAHHYLMGRKASAGRTFRKAMLLQPEDYNLTLMYLQVLGSIPDWDLLVIESNEAFKRFPDKSELLALSIAANYNIGDFDSVIQICEEMVRRFPTDKKVLIDAYTTMGDIYYQQENTAKAFKAFDKVLSIDPDNNIVLNNYAYYIALTGKDLKKAYRMSRKTIEIDPDNPTNLDTFGWILHLMGRDLEAKPFFKHAMLYGGKENKTILLHYAEVLERLGENDLAKVYREQAKSKSDE